MMLDLLCKEIISYTLDPNIANYCNTDVAGDKPSERLLTIGSFVEAMVTFVRRKMDNAMNN